MKDKDQLMYDMEKRLKTTMIGAIAKFEESFGYLWEEESDKRLIYDSLWEQTRNNILNHGNHQIRLALKELGEALYNQPVFKEKYHYKFYFNKNDRGDSYEN